MDENSNQRTPVDTGSGCVYGAAVRTQHAHRSACVQHDQLLSEDQTKQVTVVIVSSNDGLTEPRLPSAT